MSDLCRKLFFCCAPNRSKVDYDNVLADSEREAVADLLNYLENVIHTTTTPYPGLASIHAQGGRPHACHDLFADLECDRREPRPTSSLASR
jgi:hypothetical protein